MTDPCEPIHPCERARSRLFEPGLDGEARVELDAHLAACPACVEAMVESLRLREALRELAAREEAAPAAPLDPAVAERFVRAMVSAAAAPVAHIERRRA